MRDYFDLDARIINLNSGTMSVTPRDVQHQITEETNTYNLLPAMSLFETWARLWEVQNILAKYFGADPNHLFLRPNVTYVLNDILLSASKSTEDFVNRFSHTFRQILFFIIPATVALIILRAQIVRVILSSGAHRAVGEGISRIVIL
jgi:hypothetical protein